MDFDIDFFFFGLGLGSCYKGFTSNLNFWQYFHCVRKGIRIDFEIERHFTSCDPCHDISRIIFGHIF